MGKTLSIRAYLNSSQLPRLSRSHCHQRILFQHSPTIAHFVVHILLILRIIQIASRSHNS